MKPLYESILDDDQTIKRQQAESIDYCIVEIVKTLVDTYSDLFLFSSAQLNRSEDEVFIMTKPKFLEEFTSYINKHSTKSIAVNLKGFFDELFGPLFTKLVQKKIITKQRNSPTATLISNYVYVTYVVKQLELLEISICGLNISSIQRLDSSSYKHVEYFLRISAELLPANVNCSEIHNKFKQVFKQLS